MEFPFEREALAEDIREDTGVSEGISRGERARAKGARSARVVNRRIMMGVIEERRTWKGENETFVLEDLNYLNNSFESGKRAS